MGAITKAAKWLWDSFGNLTTLASLVMGFALPAWAVHAAHLFVRYSPASWVLAGLGGMLVVAAAYLLIGMGRAHWVRAAYDRKMLAKGGAIDPMGKSFERKRIYLNEFSLPSHPLIEGKTFIDCEIIGPANILLEFGNNLDDPKPPTVDAVILATGRTFANGYVFRNCTFRSCSLQRVTLFITEAEYPNRIHLNWLNWITYAPPDPPAAQALDFSLPAAEPSHP